MSFESSSIQNLSGDKLLTFAIGQQKKSRFQKEREDKELKRKQDEEDAAKVYQSFVASFNDDGEDLSKRFVRAGESLDASVEAKPTIRAPQKLSETDEMMLELKAQDGERGERRRRKASFDITVSSSSTKRTRNMDEMLDEFKSKHEDPSTNSFQLPEVDYLAQDTEKGSFDTGDPYTTNLYVGNINPATTEEHLTTVFAAYGEINSVKIMWPRSEEERARNRNTGFVSFKRRADADVARRELDKSILSGHALIVGWGKAVKISSAPVAPLVLSTNFANSAQQPAFPASIFPPPPPPPSLPMLTVHIPAENKVKSTIDVIAGYVATDGEAFEKELMQREANNMSFHFLFPHGHVNHHPVLHLYYRYRVYANLMSYERSDQPFQIVVDGPWIQPPLLAAANADKQGQEEMEGSLDGRRSRSRSPSYSSDDHDRNNRNRKRRRSHSRDRGRSNREQDRERYKDMTGAQIEREKYKARLARRARLNKDDYEELNHLLRNLTLSRTAIKQAMGFAFDHIEHAEDIITIIKEKLIKHSLFPAIKISGLYLLSDILHNSASPIKFATNYRVLIEKCIPEVIEHISISLRAATGRMSALAIEERAKKVLSTWESWCIFPERFLTGLEVIMMMNEHDLQSLQTITIDTNDGKDGQEEQERLQKKARSLGIATEGSSLNDMKRKIAFVEMKIKLRNAHTSAASAQKQQQEEQEVNMESDDDIDGAPLIADVDGQSIDVDNTHDIDGVPLSNDLDQQEQEEEEDIDGAPMIMNGNEEMGQEDVDGMPMEEGIDGVPLT